MSMVHGGNDELHALLTIVIIMMMITLVLITMSVRMVLIRFSTMSLELHQQLLSSPQVLPPTRTTTQSTGFMRSDISDQIYTSMKILMCQLNVKLGIVTKTQRKWKTKARKIFPTGEWKRKPALVWICCWSPYLELRPQQGPHFQYALPY